MIVQVSVASSGGALLPLVVASDDAVGVGRAVALDGLEAALAIEGRSKVGPVPYVVLPLEVAVVGPPS